MGRVLNKLPDDPCVLHDEKLGTFIGKEFGYFFWSKLHPKYLVYKKGMVQTFKNLRAMLKLMIDMRQNGGPRLSGCGGCYGSNLQEREIEQITESGYIHVSVLKKANDWECPPLIRMSVKAEFTKPDPNTPPGPPKITWGEVNKTKGGGEQHRD